jgi:hypothetical protein
MTMRKLLPLVFVVGVIEAIRVDEDPAEEVRVAGPEATNSSDEDMVIANQSDDGQADPATVAALVKANKDQVKAQQATKHQAAAQVVAEKRARNAKRLELKAMAEKEYSEKLQVDSKQADLLAVKEFYEAQEATGKAEKAHLWERMLTKAHQSSEKDLADSAQQEESTAVQEEDMRKARELSAAKGEKEAERMRAAAAMSDYYSKRSADTALTVEKAKEDEAHAHKVAVDKHAARDVLEDQMLRAKEKAKHSADELAKANEALQTTIEENEESADGAIEDYTAAMDAAVTADLAAKDAQDKAAAEKAAYAAVIADQAVTSATKAAAAAKLAGNAIKLAASR